MLDVKRILQISRKWDHLTFEEVLIIEKAELFHILLQD